MYVYLLSSGQAVSQFTTSPKLDKLGMRGSNTSEVVFDNVKVPGEQLVYSLCILSIFSVYCVYILCIFSVYSLCVPSILLV